MRLIQIQYRERDVSLFAFAIKRRSPQQGIFITLRLPASKYFAKVKGSPIPFFLKVQGLPSTGLEKQFVPRQGQKILLFTNFTAVLVQYVYASFLGTAIRMENAVQYCSDLGFFSLFNREGVYNLSSLSKSVYLFMETLR